MSSRQKNKQKTTATYKETQEQIRIEIGKTVGEIFSSTTDDNIKELEAQFIETVDELEIEPIIVEHTMKAVDRIIKEEDYSNFEKEDWVQRVPETVLESMSIAQTLTKDDRERIKNSVIEFMDSKAFEKAMAEKLLALSKDEETDEKGSEQDLDAVLLITKQKVVSTAGDDEIPIGKAASEKKTVKDNNKEAQSAASALKRSFAFMQNSAEEMVNLIKKHVS